MAYYAVTGLNVADGTRYEAGDEVAAPEEWMIEQALVTTTQPKRVVAKHVRVDVLPAYTEDVEVP